jgi:hypothetical protein
LERSLILRRKRIDMDKDTYGECLERFTSNSYYQLHKGLVFAFGFEKTGFIANLLDKCKYFRDRDMIKDDWFFLSHKYQMLNLNFKENKLRHIKKFFQKQGVLKIEKRGLPAREWYWVDVYRLEEIIRRQEKKRKEAVKAGIKTLEGDTLSIPTSGTELQKVESQRVETVESHTKNKLLENLKPNYNSSNEEYNSESDLSDANQIMNHWNEIFKDVKITKHESINSKILKPKDSNDYLRLHEIISTVLKSHSTATIIEAISNYFTVITSDNYYYLTKHSLGKFLFHRYYEKFLSENKPLTQLQKPDSDISKMFKPKTETYDQIYDKKNQKYYGFSMSVIRNWKGRRSDLDFYIKLIGNEVKLSGSDKMITPKPEWEFSDVWLLELVIAGMIFHFKDLSSDDKQSLNRYFQLWLDKRNVIK